MVLRLRLLEGLRLTLLRLRLLEGLRLTLLRLRLEVGDLTVDGAGRERPLCFTAGERRDDG